MQLLHTKMYPQSELDNYKLQVDLLHDKLKRSEENRQQLEQELTQILHKRNEHDKALRSKSRQKYQQFLDEQQKRNERNKMLVQMLERIDQQTATLSARSERLKMMKLQYERYIAKLMQTQTMHCIQNTPTAAIPILLPAAAATAPTANISTSIRNNDNAAASTAYQFDANLMATVPTAGNITMAQQPPPPAAQAIVTSTSAATPAPQLTPRIWTLAMATPTPAGLLLTSAPTPPTTSAQPPSTTIQQEYFANYLQYPTPFGYMPLIQQQQHQQQLQQTPLQPSPRMVPTTTYSSDLLQTNRNSYNNSSSNDNNDRMNDAILGDAKKLATTIDSPATKYDSNNFAVAAAGKRIVPTMSSTAIPLRKDDYNYDDDNNTDQQHLLSTAAVPSSSFSALTFDKLPTHLTDATAAADDKNNDIVFAAAAATASKKPQVSLSINDFVGNNSNNYENGALPNSRVEYEKSESFTIPRAVTAVNDNRNNNDIDVAAVSSSLAAVALEKSKTPDGGYDATNLRQKFDDVTWQQRRQQLPPPASEQHKQETNMQSNVDSESRRRINMDDNGSGNLRDIDEKRGEAQNRNASLSSSRYSEASHANSDAAAPPPLMNDKTGNQFSQSQMESSIAAPATSAAVAAAAAVLNPAATQMSIENIENAIYGELVNPPMTVDKPVAQEYFEDLVAKQPQQNQQAMSVAGAVEKESVIERNPATAVAFEQKQQHELQADYTNYPTPTYAGVGEDATISSAIMSGDGGSDSYDPTYATIEGTTNAEVYSTQAINESNVAAYDVGGQQQEANAVDYAQYDVAQPDYTNVDYANYDATQYDASAYDPNAYPGYTYDETTGQYTPTDPNAEQQQYATDEAYAAAYEQQQPEQQYDPNQQDANYDYSAYEQQEQEQHAENITPTAEVPTMEVAAAVDEVVAPAASVTTTADDDDATAAAAFSKANLKQPTSILSTSAATAVAAANDAHKKKKRVNFIDSSETDDSSSMKVTAGGAGAGATVSTGATGAGVVVSSESDFDFSNNGGDSGSAVGPGGGKEGT